MTNQTMKNTPTPEKTKIDTIEINITNVCNLRCKACSHFSWLLPQVHPPTEQILESIRLWSHKIGVKTARLQGGEPTLHPGFERILECVHEAFNNPKIEIWTNGTTLPQMANIPFEKYNAMFHISEHFDITVPDGIPVVRIIDRRKHNLRYHIIDGKPKPIIASARGKCKCWVKTLQNYQLWHCAVLPFIAGYFRDIYKCEYKPATLDFSQEQLRQWLSQRNGLLESSACDVCNVLVTNNYVQALQAKC